MNFKRFLMLLLALSLVASLAACNGGGGDNTDECTHVDADDDYLCDKCGEHFDDGDETEGNQPGATNAEISFVVKFADGNTLSGVKFTLTRGDKVYELESGADGSVKHTVDFGTYEVYVDSETLPEYCYADTYGLKIEEGVNSLDIIIVDNTPNGSRENPFWLTENETDISIEPGAELHFNYRGSTLKILTIDNEHLIINFNGESFTPIDGVVSAEIAPAEIGQITTFSIKNGSASPVNAILKAYAPLGTEENPFELSGNTATATVAEEQEMHYIYTAEKDGVLLILNKTEGGSITAVRNLEKYIEGFDEPIIIPIHSQTNDGNSTYTYVKAGEKIKISASYTGNYATDGETHDVEFGFTLYEGTEADPVPVFGDDLSISLDGGASIVFVAAADGTVVISADEGTTLSLNGNALTVGADSRYTIEVKANDRITAENSTEEISRVEIIL